MSLDCAGTMAARHERLSGWGRSPVENCTVFRPASPAAERDVVCGGPPESLIPRGLGRAYGDSALNDRSGVVDQTGLNCFLDFDANTGLLDCEAGVSLADIYDHLLPRGWYVAVTPGTKFVTIGGAIAADVHGKNHHRVGSFGNAVRSFDLLLADGSTRTCRPSDDNGQAKLFWATVGGMGLTGIITRARLQLSRVPSAYCLVDYRRMRDLDATLDCFQQTDGDYQYSVAWIDGLARGRSLGRSVVMLANDAPPDSLPRDLRNDPFRVPRRRTRSIPCEVPAGVLNSWTVRALNTWYYAAHRDARQVVEYDAFFYPLDGVLKWNRLYGRKGFVQFQALFPRETSRQALVGLLAEITASRRASFLAILKSSGAATPGMLSYLYPGHTLALDFADTGSDLRQWLAGLEKMLLDYGGRLYLAKDAMMSAAAFAAMYPRRDEFLSVKQEVDPGDRFQSSQARRLGLLSRCAGRQGAMAP